jgi:hypothetical protein
LCTSGKIKNASWKLAPHNRLVALASSRRLCVRVAKNEKGQLEDGATPTPHDSHGASIRASSKIKNATWKVALHELRPIETRSARRVGQAAAKSQPVSAC